MRKSYGAEYLNDIQSAGCLSFIDILTRVVFKGHRWETSCIDHSYSNIQPERLQTYVVTSGISDHFSTLTKIIDAKNINISKQTIYRRKKTLTSTEIKSQSAAWPSQHSQAQPCGEYSILKTGYVSQRRKV